MLEHMRMMTKLRPYVRQFLKEANQMFEMHIYTMGDRPYACEMAKLLDPGDQFFSGRIISRDDGTQKHQKDLDVVLAEESAVLILDDTENVSIIEIIIIFFPDFYYWRGSLGLYLLLTESWLLLMEIVVCLLVSRNICMLHSGMYVLLSTWCQNDNPIWF